MPSAVASLRHTVPVAVHNQSNNLALAHPSRSLLVVAMAKAGLDSHSDIVLKAASIHHLSGQSLLVDSDGAATQVSTLELVSALVGSTLVECWTYRVF